MTPGYAAATLCAWRAGERPPVRSRATGPPGHRSASALRPGRARFPPKGGRTQAVRSRTRPNTNLQQPARRELTEPRSGNVRAPAGGNARRTERALAQSRAFGEIRAGPMFQNDETSCQKTGVSDGRPLRRKPTRFQVDPGFVGQKAGFRGQIPLINRM
jgi:hypothetical protein